MMGRAFQDDVDLLRVLKQLKYVGNSPQHDVDLLRVLKQLRYVWNSPRNQWAILLEPCFPGRC